MARQSNAVVDQRATAMALRTASKIARKRGRGSPYADLHLDSVQRRAIREGKTPVIKRNTKPAEWIVYTLLKEMDGARNQRRADRLRGAIREAFGDKAYFGAQRFLESIRGNPPEAAAGAPIPQRRMLEAGTHIAPFLSQSGGIVLVTVDAGSQLAFIAECGEPRGGMVNNGVDGNEFTAKGEIDLIDSGYATLAAMRGKLTVKQGGQDVSPYGDKLFGYGIHTAPWRPWNQPEGFSLVAIDKENRLVAMMDAANPPAARSARRELGVLLELLAPEPYRDPYNDGHETDMDNGCGEGWKQKR